LSIIRSGLERRERGAPNLLEMYLASIESESERRMVIRGLRSIVGREETERLEKRHCTPEDLSLVQLLKTAQSAEAAGSVIDQALKSVSALGPRPGIELAREALDVLVNAACRRLVLHPGAVYIELSKQYPPALDHLAGRYDEAVRTRTKGELGNLPVTVAVIAILLRHERLIPAIINVVRAEGVDWFRELCRSNDLRPFLPKETWQPLLTALDGAFRASRSVHAKLNIAAGIFAMSSTAPPS
jgi:hypothetical protein